MPKVHPKRGCHVCLQKSLPYKSAAISQRGCNYSNIIYALRYTAYIFCHAGGCAHIKNSYKPLFKYMIAIQCVWHLRYQEILSSCNNNIHACYSPLPPTPNVNFWFGFPTGPKMEPFTADGVILRGKILKGWGREREIPWQAVKGWDERAVLKITNKSGFLQGYFSNSWFGPSSSEMQQCHQNSSFFKKSLFINRIWKTNRYFGIKH